MVPRQRSFRINGYDLSRLEAGEASAIPLLLVHGSLCDQRIWTAQMAAFAGHYRVLALSLRHFWPEQWDGTGNGYEIRQHAEDIAALIAHLDVGPVHLLGHSRGGHVCFRVAQHYPELIRALILAEPGGQLDPALADHGAPAPGADLGRMFEDSANLIAGGETDAGLELFVTAVGGPKAWKYATEGFKAMARDNAMTIIGQAREARLTFMKAEIENIDMPVLLIGGALTRGHFPKVLDAMQRLMPGAERVTIEGAGHPMYEQRPAPFNDAVLGFLALR
ncbi:MAG: alpha/beta fold hydrolase [Ferrovibrio sp.]